MSEFLVGVFFALAVWCGVDTVASLFMLGKTHKYTMNDTLVYLLLTIVFVALSNMIALGVL